MALFFAELELNRFSSVYIHEKHLWALRHILVYLKNVISLFMISLAEWWYLYNIKRNVKGESLWALNLKKYIIYYYCWYSLS